MKKKEKHILNLKDTTEKGPRKYYISSQEVGDIWRSKQIVKNIKYYSLENFSKNNIKLNNDAIDSTKSSCAHIIKQFNKNKNVPFIREIIKTAEKPIIKNIYSEYPYLFINFINKINLKNKKDIAYWISRFGLLGDSDSASLNQENLFLSNDRHEPMLLWEYEKWHLKYAYELWNEIIHYEHQQNPANLLKKYFVLKENKYLPKFEKNKNFPIFIDKLFEKHEPFFDKRDHDILLDAAKALCGMIIQDHLEHRVSFPVEFNDFTSPVPILETDSLIGTMWLQLLNYVRGEKLNKAICKNDQCGYEFKVFGNKSKFCSTDCKTKFYNNKS